MIEITSIKWLVNATVNVLESFGMGCDLERFDPKKTDAQKVASLKAELGIEDDDFVYIFIGRQTNFKGFDKVVKAFFKTQETHPKSKLILVGEKDRIHPTSLGSKWEKALKANTSIIKVGWRENVQDYLALSDLNVFPSEREGLPVNLMESLAMGVPVLTVNSRGCRDVVRHDVDGVVIDDTSIEAIAAAMCDLQDDPEKLEKYRENALAGRDRFDRKHFVEEQFRIIERLVGKPV